MGSGRNLGIAAGLEAGQSQINLGSEAHAGSIVPSTCRMKAFPKRIMPLNGNIIHKLPSNFAKGVISCSEFVEDGKPSSLLDLQLLPKRREGHSF